MRIAETTLPLAGMPRFVALDGWRGISILLVLAGHLFPLGPKYLKMNECIASLGMAIFFTLSGFLITTTLLYRPSVAEFLIRRLCRIVPLAWLFTLIAVTLAKVSFHYTAQILFFSNLPPFWADRLYGPLMEPVRRDAVLYRH
jgi:peptidoglycan/LPS O-acetylase OafA/YrhL